jgi:hypothetical protein
MHHLTLQRRSCAHHRYHSLSTTDMKRHVCKGRARITASRDRRIGQVPLLLCCHGFDQELALERGCGSYIDPKGSLGSLGTSLQTALRGAVDMHGIDCLLLKAITTTCQDSTVCSHISNHCNKAEPE